MIGVVTGNGDNNCHQYKKQFVDSRLVHFFIDVPSGNSSGDAAAYHDQQPRKLKVWDSAGYQGSQQAGSLGNQNDIQAVLRGFFHIH